jgi:hypothetical protein
MAFHNIHKQCAEGYSYGNKAADDGLKLFCAQVEQLAYCRGDCAYATSVTQQLLIN